MQCNAMQCNAIPFDLYPFSIYELHFRTLPSSAGNSLIDLFVFNQLDDDDDDDDDDDVDLPTLPSSSNSL